MIMQFKFPKLFHNFGPAESALGQERQIEHRTWRAQFVWFTGGMAAAATICRRANSRTDKWLVAYKFVSHFLF